MFGYGLFYFSPLLAHAVLIQLILMPRFPIMTNTKKILRSIKNLKYDRLYIKKLVRPTAESYVKAGNHEKMNLSVEILKGISILI